MLGWGQFCSFGQLVLGNRGQWVVTGAPAHLHPLCACTPSLLHPLPFAPPPFCTPSLLAPLSACPPPLASSLFAPHPQYFGCRALGGVAFPPHWDYFLSCFLPSGHCCLGEGCLWFSWPISTPGSFRRVSVLDVSPAQPTIQLHFRTICGLSSSLLRGWARALFPHPHCFWFCRSLTHRQQPRGFTPAFPPSTFLSPLGEISSVLLGIPQCYLPAGTCPRSPPGAFLGSRAAVSMCRAQAHTGGWELPSASHCGRPGLVIVG